MRCCVPSVPGPRPPGARSHRLLNVLRQNLFTHSCLSCGCVIPPPTAYIYLVFVPNNELRDGKKTRLLTFPSLGKNRARRALLTAISASGPREELRLLLPETPPPILSSNANLRASKRAHASRAQAVAKRAGKIQKYSKIVCMRGKAHAIYCAGDRRWRRGTHKMLQPKNCFS